MKTHRVVRYMQFVNTSTGVLRYSSLYSAMTLYISPYQMLLYLLCLYALLLFCKFVLQEVLMDCFGILQGRSRPIISI